MSRLAIYRRHMAERVDSFPDLRHGGRGSRSRRIPEDWFDGSIWEIVPGVDMRSATPEKAKIQLRATARDRRHRVQVAIKDDKVYVQRIGERS